MRSALQLGEHPAQAVIDGAIGLGLAAGAPIPLRGPPTGADLALVLPAVTRRRAAARGLRRQGTGAAAGAGGRPAAGLGAAGRVVRAMRRCGVIAGAGRVPLPLPASWAARSCWAITASAECENSVVTV